MEHLDELCVGAGRDPASLRRCSFAGWADEPFFAWKESLADLVGRYVGAGATDFTFYLASPDDHSFDGLVAAHRAATRDRLEGAVTDVLPAFRA